MINFYRVAISLRALLYDNAHDDHQRLINTTTDVSFFGHDLVWDSVWSVRCDGGTHYDDGAWAQ